MVDIRWVWTRFVIANTQQKLDEERRRWIVGVDTRVDVHTTMNKTTDQEDEWITFVFSKLAWATDEFRDKIFVKKMDDNRNQRKFHCI